MILRKSLLALALVTALPPSLAQAAADPAVSESLQSARNLEEAGRFGDAWEAADTALSAATGAERMALEELRSRVAEKSGFLSLRVEPDGAEVFVAAVSFGLTPIPALRRVSVGRHEVRVVKAGFETFQQTVQVAPEGKAVVSVSLVRESAVGSVRVRDESGQPIHVIVDGVDIGPAPLERDLAPGKHAVSGAGVDRVAPEREIDVVRGRTADLVLVSRPLQATVKLTTTDAKGVIRIDGAVVGEGSYEGAVRLGVHRLDVTREGRQPWRRDLVLHDGEAFSEEVHLEEPPTTVLADDGYVPPTAGWYGGVSAIGWLGPTGAGSELEIGCVALGAATCKTSRPLGGGLTFHVGYDFDPIGFELRVAGLGDYWAGEARFDGDVAAASGNVAATPVRKETFDVARIGGTASLQVRATGKLGAFALSGAVGPGVSYKSGVLVRRAELADSNLSGAYGAPSTTDPVSVVSPALTADVGVGIRIGSASWLTLGLFGIVESAGNEFRSQPGLGAAASIAGVQVDPALSQFGGLPSPSYHLASGTQYIVGPEIAFRFGP